MKSIRQKLMVLVCLICAVLIGMVLLFAQFLLQPTYLAMVKADLGRELEAVAVAVERCGLFNDAGTGFSEELRRGIQPLITDGQCLEISDLATGAYIGGAEHISSCTLHTVPLDSNWMDLTERRSTNSMLLLRLRAQVAEQGALAGSEVSGPNGLVQYVVGRQVPSQGVILLLSTNLERITQAVAALQKLLTWVGVILVVTALVLAWIFAGWFTRPITALSAAARRMARGDYSVQVPVTSKDELGALTRDFNAMAREVGQTDALQKDLIANVSHDLRTPLTIIKGYAETIRDLSGDDPVRRAAQLDVVISESDRLSVLVGSVMELSRLNAGTERLCPLAFDLGEMCEELCARYEDICAKSGCRLLLEGQGERMIYADPDLILRVLHNLVSNAVAHVGPDGVIILRLREAAGGVRVEVEDHGEGIPQEELPRIFRRYYRARQANGRPGTGLGLSIVRAILQAHHFPFGVHSRVGEGSVFWFGAPLYTGTPDKPAAPEKPGAAEKKGAPEKRDAPEKKGTPEKKNAPEKRDTAKKPAVPDKPPADKRPGTPDKPPADKSPAAPPAGPPPADEGGKA